MVGILTMLSGFSVFSFVIIFIFSFDTVMQVKELLTNSAADKPAVDFLEKFKNTVILLALNIALILLGFFMVLFCDKSIDCINALFYIIFGIGSIGGWLVTYKCLHYINLSDKFIKT